MERKRRDLLRAGAATAGGLFAGCQGLLEGETPEPTVRNVSLGERSSLVGDRLSVSAEVENPASSEQRTTLILHVDGEKVANQTVTIADDTNRTVSFTHRFESTGNYTLDVNGVEPRPVSVGPAVRIRSVRSEEEVIVTGHAATIVATVENRSSDPRERTFALTADGETIKTKSKELPGNERTAVTFEPTFETTGERSLAVNDVPAGTVTVSEPITLSDPSLVTDSVPLGHVIEVSATAENLVSETSTRTVTVTADGSALTNHTIELEPEAERTVTIPVAVSTTGETTLTVAGTTVGTAHVTPSWRQFGNGPTNTGRARETDGPESAVSTAWSHDVMGGSSSVPAVAGDTVYWGTGNPYGAADDGRLLALSTADGSVRWSVDAGGRIHGTPAVTRSVVVADTVTGRLSDENVDGTVIGLDAADGTKRWTVETGAISGSPVVHKGRVYVATRGSVLALDPKTGERHWERSIEDWFSGVAVQDGTAYVTGMSGVVRALDTSDGSKQWQTNLSSRITGPPSVADDTLYTAAGRNDSAIYALDAASGEQRWRSPTEGVPSATIAVGETGLFTGVGIAIHAFERSDGSVRWQGPDNVAGSLRPGVAAVVDGTVYAGVGRVNGGVLFAFDAASGDIEWRKSLDISSESVVVQDGTIYTPTGFGTLSALEA